MEEKVRAFNSTLENLVSQQEADIHKKNEALNSKDIQISELQERVEQMQVQIDEVVY